MQIRLNYNGADITRIHIFALNTSANKLQWCVNSADGGLINLVKSTEERAHAHTGAVHIFNISEVAAESCTGMQKGS